jgi:hypothetical protein
VTLRQWQIYAVALTLLGGVLFHLSYNTDGPPSTAATWVGIAYLVALIPFNRWIQRRFADRNAGPS